LAFFQLSHVEQKIEVEQSMSESFGKIHHYNENAYIFATKEITKEGLILQSHTGVDCGKIYLNEDQEVCVKTMNEEPLRINKKKVRVEQNVTLQNEDEIIIGVHPTSFYFKFVAPRQERTIVAEHDTTPASIPKDRKRKSLSKSDAKRVQKRTRLTLATEAPRDLTPYETTQEPLMDNDCLFLVLQFLTLPDISKLSLVSKQFLQVTSTDAIWRPVCEKLFLQDFSDARSAFMNIVNSIPKFVSRQDYEERSKVNNKKCTSWSIKSSHTWLTLPKNVKCTLQHHKLATILSALCENGYQPKLAEPCIIGYEGGYDKEETTKKIPLYQYCCSVLAGKEKELIVDQLGLPAEHKPTWRDVPVGLMPNIEGEFTPFIYPLVAPTPAVKKGFRHTSMPKDEKHGGVYRMLSGDHEVDHIPDWTPVYFNASGFWYTIAENVSIYYPQSNRILVVKIQTNEAQF
jgi:hypothetical protein